MHYRNVALAALLALSTTPATASDYFDTVEGNWRGNGDIVDGKYKGTKFSCQLKGLPHQGTQMTIAGTCRVGLFTQKISANIVKKGKRYRGTFLDGANGKGMDVVSGRLRANRLTVGIKRKALEGALVANLTDRNSLRISISVDVGGRYVPVIGLDLKRSGGKRSAALR